MELTKEEIPISINSSPYASTTDIDDIQHPLPSPRNFDEHCYLASTTDISDKDQCLDIIPDLSAFDNYSRFTSATDTCDTDQLMDIPRVSGIAGSFNDQSQSASLTTCDTDQQIDILPDPATFDDQSQSTTATDTDQDLVTVPDAVTGCAHSDCESQPVSTFGGRQSQSSGKTIPVAEYTTDKAANYVDIALQIPSARKEASKTRKRQAKQKPAVRYNDLSEDELHGPSTVVRSDFGSTFRRRSRATGK